ncbi:MAG TPA: protein translocase subunit SecD [Corynebacterium xerosis]|uniref:protein translocase subunit SecD n=1 Tax=Corynebacterium xerosis TaxID=1725 RepID=UPI000767A207|nr:protein translocase subunit SecD [Corynebacterium xerosis]SQB95075.1 preprotein translocase subunit SecD [Clostridium paraputrificum]HJG58340.1 protein translocase subunit SecD [Corynebacterium xerosis]
MASSSRGANRGFRAKWPQWSLLLFVALLVLTYVLVFFTGNREATPKLGIDLQGGTRVTLVPQGEKPTQDQLDQARRILENRVNGMGVTGAQVVADGDTLVITVPGEDSQEARALGQTSQLFFRPVAEPGAPDPAALTDATLDMANKWVSVGLITPEEANEGLEQLHESLGADLERTRTMFEEQNPDQPIPSELQFEVGEPGKVIEAAPEEPSNSVEAAEQREAVRAVLLESRQSDDPTTQFAAQGLMRCDDPEAADPLAGADDPSKPLVTCDPNTPGATLTLDPAPLLVGETDEVNGKRLSGDDIDTDAPINGGYDQQSGEVQVSFSFKSGNNDAGARTWTQLTTDYLQRQVAIVLDSEVISAPVIQDPTPVGQATRITGDFSIEEAQTLANNLRYGALPLSFAGEDGEPGGTATTIPATMGSASLSAGVIAGLVGIGLIVLYALALYRGLGAISIISMAAAGAMIYGVLVLLGRWIGYSLDLAGIAGIIISIGTTADSFIVFFERIKDELRIGRTFRSAVPHAWRNAKRTILSGNFVSIIAAVVLYVLAVGDVRGFAFTLGLSTVFDIVTAFLVTAPLVILATRKYPSLAKPSMNGFGSVMKLASDRGANRRKAGKARTELQEAK